MSQLKDESQETEEEFAYVDSEVKVLPGEIYESELKSESQNEETNSQFDG